MAKPILYIIAGCNGAGKTTASYNVLPQILDCKEFVNADEIAKGISPFAPESVSILAGKLMLERIEFLINARISFAIETTLATRSYKHLISKAKEMGFEIQLLYFWLESPEVACQRVEKRVKEGGHNIPIKVIFRRYFSGIENLFNIFIPLVDYWAIYDNNFVPCLIADSNRVIIQDTLSKIQELSCQKKNS